MTPLPPVIKWSGSKRLVARFLSDLFLPAKVFFDPFVGGGALLPVRKTRLAVAGDIVEELIDLWLLIQKYPQKVALAYEQRWRQLQEEGYTVYYKIRKRFNQKRDPLDLLFLTRTCVNGLIRFNSRGQFNNSFHYTRPGISPDKLKDLILAWSRVLDGVSFQEGDYRETLAMVQSGDFVFLDPPYVGTRGRYIPESFNFEEFCRELDRLNSIGAKWVLTLDGKAGRRNYSVSVPKELYKRRLMVSTGKSPFTRLMKKSLDQVQESVFLNF